jgi:Mg2+-importing ATPase
VLLGLFSASVTQFRTAWFVESLWTELAIALVVRTRRPFFRSRPGTLLLRLSVGVAVMALALPYLPGVDLLGFVTLPPGLMLALLAITAAYVLATEALKLRFRRAWK